MKSDGVRLATYSGLILFLELALIRYTAGYVHLFSFYLNFVLIATFLGMGVGLMNGHRAPALRWLAIPAVLLVFGGIAWFSRALIVVPLDPDDLLWSIYIEPGRHRVSMLAMSTTMFAFCSLLFVPLGALMGAEFRKLAPLRAYAWDIGGGLTGIVVFGLLSAMRQEPLVWLAIAFGVWTVASLPDRRFALAIGVTGALAAVSTQFMDRGRPVSYWSPYYRINVRAMNATFQVDVNGSLHQVAMFFDSTRANFDPYTRAARAGYLQPYQLVDRIDTALVVGAGTGNDLSVLLMRGAKYIDAVEIDPMIAEIGADAHPMQPYADPRIHLHVNDARAFLRTTPRKYDLIVFGTLDSQTLLSGMSSVRLDNYVYTVESFRSARQRLTPNGSLFVYHMSGYDYIAGKIYRMLAEAFDAPPGVFYGDWNLFNHVFVEGAAASRVPALAPERRQALEAPQSDAHDDWPYLYLRRRVIPGHYIAALTGLLVVSLVFVGVGGRASLVRGFDGAMFFMGAGFLLVETKSVTEMSLLFGSTWKVNLLVFSSILVMVLVANLLVMRRPPRRVTPLYFGLLGSLAVAWALPASRLLGLGALGQWLLGGLMVALPIFFAAVIFSALLGQRADGSRALAYNLLGAIVGGTLEYSSMIIGIKGLYVVAGALYACAMLPVWRRERQGAAPPGVSSQTAVLPGAEASPPGALSGTGRD